MKKVMLSNKVGKALTVLIKELGVDELYKFENVLGHYKSSNKYTGKMQDHINTIVNYVRKSNENRVKYYMALTNGYELELSKEEKVFEMYMGTTDLLKKGSDTDYNLGYLRGIKDVLTTMKIEIKGVNVPIK